MSIELYNEEIRQWGITLLAQIKTNARRYNIKHSAYSSSSGDSVQKIRIAYSQKDGLINKVSIKLNRSLVYPHKGAGRGIGGNKGSRWIDRYGRMKKTNPESLGKIPHPSRPPKPFINDALDGGNGLEELADIVAKDLAVIITDNAKIK